MEITYITDNLLETSKEFKKINFQHNKKSLVVAS